MASMSHCPFKIIVQVKNQKAKCMYPHYDGLSKNNFVIIENISTDSDKIVFWVLYILLQADVIISNSPELEIRVDHRPFSDCFRDLAKQIQFARTNILITLNGEANNSL